MPQPFSSYMGRFAPSPTGPLHAGSLVAALASWLDAKAHGGLWLVRMEDIDAPRCKAEHAALILQQLAAHGLVSDGPVLTQSLRLPRYEAALAQLYSSGLCYPCSCSRKTILQVLAERGTPPGRNQELVYPGTCRPTGATTASSHFAPQVQPRPTTALAHLLASHPTPPGAHCAWRLNLARICPGPHTECLMHWQDRRLGPQAQNLPEAVGDFVLKRADGYFAYQLAVVVDDAAQGITNVVRGEDLADNTARQIALQQALGLPTPQYLHTPLVLGANGEKLSKQNGAQALGLQDPLGNLEQAALCLGLCPPTRAQGPAPLTPLLQELVPQWAARWAIAP